MKKFGCFVLACSLLSGCASKTESVPVVGVAQIVSHTSLNTIRDSFTERMEELGYIDGETIQFHYADASGQQANLNSIMNQFEQENSDCIVAIATPTAQAAANVSESIPIVFSAVSDPVGAKLVETMEHPGGNITGTCDEVQVDKIFDLMLQIKPDIQSIGFIYNASEINSVSNLKKAKAYCDKHGLRLEVVTGKDMTELQSAMQVLCPKVDVVFAPNDNTVASGMQALSQVAIEMGKLFFVGADSMVQDGGFATVGIDYEILGEKTADMVDEILKGKKTADIPVTVFKENLNIYINKKTLEMYQLDLPENMKDTVVFMGE